MAHLVVAATAVVPTVAVLRIFAGRLTYPVDLEWCEGGSLYMGWRLLQHLPVYVKPGDVFAPFPYPPGHTLALALAGWLSGGLDFGPARAVSVCSYVLLCGTLFWVSAREFPDRRTAATAGLATVGVIACTFPYTGGWYDLVRVDSMMLAFAVLAAALAGRSGMGPARMAGAAAAMTIAVFTKQTAAFFAAWICVFAVVRDRREGLRLTVLSLAFCAIALAALLGETHGQAWFWIFDNLASHPLEREELWKGLEVVRAFAPFAPAVPLAFTALALARRASSATWLWFGMLVVAVPATLLPYAKHGGWKNDMIPVVVLLVPAIMTVGADLLRTAPDWTPALRMTGALGLAAFMWMRPVHAADFVPSAADWQSARNLNAFVASLRGGLLAPQLAFTPARNGQMNPHWHRMGHADLTWSNHVVDEDWAVVRAQARYALLNGLDHSDFGRAIRRHYKLVGQLPDNERVHMLTGGGVVDLDQLWERLPGAGDPPGGQ